MVTLPDHFNKILNDKYVSGQCCDTRIMEVIETGGMYSTRTTTDESFFFFLFFCIIRNVTGVPYMVLLWYARL